MRNRYRDSKYSSSPADRQRRARIREKHNAAAIKGLHLPSNDQLLDGLVWMHDNIFEDAKTWAERILPRVDAATKAGALVAEKLAALTASPQMSDFEAAAAAFACAGEAEDRFEPELLPAEVPGYRGPDATAAELRCHIYSATLGSRASCVFVAQHCISLADSIAPTDVRVRMLAAAMGWLAVSKKATEAPVSDGQLSRYSDFRYKAELMGDSLTGDFIRDHNANLKNAADADAGQKAEDKRDKSDLERALDPHFDLEEIIESHRGKDSVKEADKSAAAKAEMAPGAVVIPEIGSDTTHEGKKIAESYKPVTGIRLPLPPLPELADVRRNLLAEFPHAGLVIDSVLKDLGTRDYVKLKPTLFVGLPGCGKTTFATRLLSELGIGCQIYPCGGVSDSSFAGTPRQWSTGNPSLPVSLVARYRTAAPGIVLDEVSRAGTSRHNGSLVDSLLSMLEPVSACRYLDPYLQSECDLSHVAWLATANDLDTLPAPLRDRFRIIVFPSPSIEHMPVLANNLLERAIEDLGYAACFEPRLDRVELEALAAVWPKSGSLRGLRKLVEAVLAARSVHPVGNA